MKTYHYCASFHETARTHWSHGVFQWDGDPIAEYGDLVKQIAASMTPPRPADDLIVHSLTVIADDSR